VGVAERVATPTEATCGAGWSSATRSPPTCGSYAPMPVPGSGQEATCHIVAARMGSLVEPDDIRQGDQRLDQRDDRA